MSEEIIYNDFCKGVQCSDYIEWEYYGKKLFSCRHLDQSENITEYPVNCNFKSEIRYWAGSENE